MMPYSFGKWQGISLYAQSHRHGWTIDIEYDSTLYSMTYTLYIWLDIPTTKAFIYLVMDHCVCVWGGGARCQVQARTNDTTVILQDWAC